MAGLLVSVRSGVEAAAAVRGGAAVIDVKEPRRGPLGRAEAAVWREVREIVPATIPVSAALGELHECAAEPPRAPADVQGIAYFKVGLAGMGAGSVEEWRFLWARLRQSWELHSEAAWVAVVYSDWKAACAPHPSDILACALVVSNCNGLLIDTWDKQRTAPLEPTRFWLDLADRVRRAGWFLALAGRLDESAMRRLAPLQPDLFAVRSAACQHSDRREAIDVRRVGSLVKCADSIPSAGALDWRGLAQSRQLNLAQNRREKSRAEP